MVNEGYMSASEWAKGIGYSIVASVVGGASKLAIRKSWLIDNQIEDDESSSSSSSSLSNHQEGFFRSNHERAVMDTSSDAVMDKTSSYSRLNDDDFVSQQMNVQVQAKVLPGAHQQPHTSSQHGNQEQFSNNDAISTKSSSGSEGSSSSSSSFFGVTTNLLSNHHHNSNNHNNDHNNVDNEHETNSSTKNRHIAALTLRYSGMFGMTVLNPLFCVLAMNYASPSILAPFSGLTLVWIILFSEQFIGERPKRKQVIAASFIILGQVIVGVFGDHKNDDGITLEEIEESYRKLSFQLFFVGVMVFLALMAYIMRYPPSQTLQRFAWGVASGTITGFQNFLKDSTSIFKASMQNNEPIPWYFFLLLGLAALTAFSGLLILTGAMKRYDATFCSSMFVGSFIITASIMADIHYHTFANLTGMVNYIMYPVGLIILMVGLYILVKDTTEAEVVDFTNADDNLVDQFQNNHHASSLRLPLVPIGKDKDDTNELT